MTAGRPDRMTLFYDGGSRPNPGPMEIAVVTGGRDHIRCDIGEGDNCTAEWLALRYALDIALAAGARDVLLVGDARTVVEQARGAWRCRSPHLQPHLAAFRLAAAAIPRLHLKHVPRAKNLAGIALARRHPR